MWTPRKRPGSFATSTTTRTTPGDTDTKQSILKPRKGIIMPDYSKCTNEDFDRILGEIVEGMTAAQILSYSEVSAILREELNNAVLDEWEREQHDHEADSENC